jgi:phage baseplate assembly protein W|tara:strand:- start:275 stop:712 length:438 start_codon:yes stop_codon:yes gene_type:complete
MAQYKEINVDGKTDVVQTQQTSQIYKGTSTVSNDSKSFSLYDINLIKQDLLNHFNIRKGEKIYNPNFGSIIWDLIHEPLTEQTTELLENDVKEVLRSDPRVLVENISIFEQQTGVQIVIEINFKDYNQLEQMVYTFDRNSGLSMA